MQQRLTLIKLPHWENALSSVLGQSTASAETHFTFVNSLCLFFFFLVDVLQQTGPRESGSPRAIKSVEVQSAREICQRIER